MKKIEEIQYRLLNIGNEEIDESNRTVPVSFSSETPVKRSFGMEILSHDKGAVDLARLNDGAPVLLDHDRKLQVGVVERAIIGADRKGRAMLRFSKSAKGEEVFQDVKDKIRRNVSVGYLIHDAEERGINEIFVTKWEPIEISFESLAADPNVGLGRSLNIEKENEVIESCQTKKIKIKVSLR